MRKASELLELIHSHAYWRVNLHPREFSQARLRDKNQCLSVVHQTSVSLEGWHYPILNDAPYEEGSDWIAGAGNISVFIEYWRFYQSGQFIHHLALREDHMGPAGLFHPQFFIPVEGQQYLSIVASIHMLTDIVEFAARLAYQSVLVPSAVLSVELHKMAGRQLTYMAPGRRLPGSFWFKDETISLGGVYSAEAVMGSPRD
jgi:hypothetical protein